MKLRVCYFGTYREDYPRNRIMIAGLQRNGVDVQECHQKLWRGIEDRVWVVSGNFWRPSFLWRVVSVYCRLILAYTHTAPYDVLVVGYPGHLDVWLARVLSWLGHKPLVMDVFMSPHLVATERGLTQRHRLTARLLYWFEWLTYRLPDMLIQDTPEYVRWFQGRFGLDPDRFRLVPTGADERVFQPGDSDSATDAFRIIYHGTFIPNHGVEYMLEAALHLRNRRDLQFEFVGDGPDQAAARAFCEQHGLANVTFTGWLHQAEVVRRLRGASICLGVFGTTPQSLMTVQNKIYECLAVGRAVVTGDSEVINREFKHKLHLYKVKRADGAAVAQAISELHSCPDLVRLLGQEGRKYFLERFTLKHLGQQYLNHLCEAAGSIIDTPSPESGRD